MPEQKICLQCHYQGEPKPLASFWRLSLIGILYVIWQWSFKVVRNTCPKCGGKTMVPIDFGRGKELNGNIERIDPVPVVIQKTPIKKIGQYMLASVFLCSAIVSYSDWGPIYTFCTVCCSLIIFPPIRDRYLSKTPLRNGAISFLTIIVLIFLGVSVGKKQPAAIDTSKPVTSHTLHGLSGKKVKP